MWSKIGAAIFFLILLVVAIGLVSFACEYFLGRPLTAIIKDFFFVMTRKT